MRRAEKELDSHGETLMGSQEENGFLRSKVDGQLQRKNSKFYEINWHAYNEFLLNRQEDYYLEAENNVNPSIRNHNTGRERGRAKNWDARNSKTSTWPWNKKGQEFDDKLRINKIKEYIFLKI